MPRQKKSNIERVVKVDQLANGMFEAFIRNRDDDGKVRPITARGESRAKALAALDEKVRNRVTPTPRKTHTEDIHAEDTVLAAAFKWLEKERAAGELSKASLSFYEGVINAAIARRTGVRSLKIGTLTAGQIERHMVGIKNGTIKVPASHIKRAGQTGKKGAPVQAKNFRTVMNLVIKQAIRDGARTDNPVVNLKRTKNEVQETRDLTGDQIEATRNAIAEWRSGKGMDLRKGGRPRDPDGVLPDCVEVLLGTGCRISEVLALAPAHCHLDGPAPYVEIRATVKTVTGEGLIREEMVKTSASRRDLAVPPFVVAALRRQIALHAKHGLVFATTKGTLVSPHNLRDNLRKALRLAGIENAELKKGGLSPVTPHAYRRTLATRLADASDEDAARDHLGHSSVAITRKSYIAKRRQVIGDPALIEDFFGHPVEDDAASAALHRGEGP